MGAEILIINLNIVKQKRVYMKQLTKNELAEFIHNTTSRIMKSRMEIFSEKLNETCHGINDYNLILVNALAILSAETQKICNETMTEVLYDIFYD